MFPYFFSIALVMGLIISVVVVLKKRRAAGITGVKTALTSICFFLIAVMNLLAYWFDFVGVWSWGITIVLIVLAAYFTKYLPVEQE